MAVQKSRKSKSKRNKRRSANTIFIAPTLSQDKETREIHMRHFITKTGYYKGNLVLKKEKKKKKYTAQDENNIT
ncbi:MAG: 50S ribosomal protein L32 [Phycisphaerales bacterium]|nr:50S ribosomal protein L32 [Phycisphaerales bacterium]